MSSSYPANGSQSANGFCGAKTVGASIKFKLACCDWLTDDLHKNKFHLDAIFRKGSDYILRCGIGICDSHTPPPFSRWTASVVTLIVKRPLRTWLRIIQSIDIFTLPSRDYKKQNSPQKPFDLCLVINGSKDVPAIWWCCCEIWQLAVCPIRRRRKKNAHNFDPPRIIIIIIIYRVIEGNFGGNQLLSTGCAQISIYHCAHVTISDDTFIFHPSYVHLTPRELFPGLSGSTLARGSSTYLEPTFDIFKVWPVPLRALRRLI